MRSFIQRPSIMSSAQDFDSIRAHPRRRPLGASRPSLVPSEEQSPSSPSRLRLRKGETFNPSILRAADRDPLVPSLPRRSPTCPGALEAIAAGQQRMADILDRLDLNSVTSSRSEDNDDLPVPKGLLKLHLRSQARKEGSVDPSRQPSPMPKERSRKAQRAHPPSDSGLGSSIGSESVSSANKGTWSWLVVFAFASANIFSVKASRAVTRSISTMEAMAAESAQRHKLSPDGRKEIEKHIIGPIFEEERLKPFHPLLENIRQQIENERISCLRDLEKTVFSLAPRVKATDALYVRFCQHTVLCLSQTVPSLSGRDLCTPTDKQYSNGYFVDLLEQVAQFKRIRDEWRKKHEADSKMKAPEIRLEGGLSKTGRPVEMVVEKDGEAISLATGKPYEEHATPSMKRSLSAASADEGAQRSMARRKKNAPPMNINKKCRDCDKVFARPCDLTKHEKSHSRPFKCPVTSCKYHTKGWATEKEAERHYNDKHSDAPRLFSCQFESCSYKSKRESNCKQHMEKTHGWVYMRSKNNGRTNKRASTQQSPSPSSSSVQPKQDFPGWSMTPPSEAPDFKQESMSIAGGWDLAPTPETPEFSFNAFQPSLNGMPTPITGTGTGTLDAVTPTTGTINSPSEPFDLPPENTAFSIQDIFPEMKANDGLLFAGGDLDFPDFTNNPNMFNDFGYNDFTMQPQGLNYGDVPQPQFEDDSAGFLLDVYNDMNPYGINPNAGPGGL
ncbi:putative C2H2 transcription factor (Ace1) [Aspergillus undulatus]|uniref:putative C2H2 transcription factor (Ace1) n=1 Tax=Aspergillus undulatus TaxID=1810928 RepID=UPI003CCD38AE